MNIAIFADIHGNLEAFKAVMAEIHKENVARIISLGDNIGYGADSEAIIGLLEKNRIESILGNHELAVVNPPFIKWFNPNSKIAVLHAIASLSEESKQTIGTFEKSLIIQNIRFVHGTPPASIALYLFQISDRSLGKKMATMEENICFTGHTHDIGLIEYDGKKITRKELKKGLTTLSDKKKYIINAGSVGQPRDGDNRSKYTLFNPETLTIDLRYVPYDYKTAAKKIIEVGLPEEYARKLYPADER